MQNVAINVDGKTEVVSVGNSEDLLYYIGEYMGNEFSSCVNECFSDKIEELKQKVGIVKEELEGYGASLESKDALLHDVERALEEIIYHIKTTKRLDKIKVAEKLRTLKQDIWNEL